MRFALIRKYRALAALPAAAAVALVVPMAAPAGASTTDTIVGGGQATGIVQGTTPTTTACETGGGYDFSGVAITGATADLTNPEASAGKVAVTAPDPVGVDSSDPLNGTPLGCDTNDAVGGVLTTVGQLSTTIPGAPQPFPVIGCAGTSCGAGASYSNVLAGEGTVTGKGGLADFGCSTGSDSIEVPADIQCSLGGTFVRYGGAVLVDLAGTITMASGNSGAVDVTVAAHVAPLPQDPLASCGALTTLFQCSEFTGPYVVTPPNGNLPPGGPAGALIYCPVTAAGLGTFSVPSTGPVCDGKTL